MIRISDVKPIGGGGATKHPVKPEVVKKDDRVDINDTSDAARFIEVLIRDAIKAQATDVHIEPHGKEVAVRYRIDGVLRPGQAALNIKIKNLAGRVKLLANLNIDEDRLPQDGRFEFSLKEKRYVVSASLMPVADGEKIVLHIVNQSTVPHDLEKLGYWGLGRQTILDATTRASGLVAVVGPVGLGKTSTLYSMVRLAHDPSHSVATIEDTIDYRIPGVNQTPVNPKAGMTYASAMRAVLRQDPNVVMISELREPEIADMALHAALGGRLILAGASGANISDGLDHIIAMRVEPYIIAAAMKVVINQRVVRKLCPKCREAYSPSAEEFSSICSVLGLKSSEVLAHISKLQKAAISDLNIKAAGQSIVNGKLVKLWRQKEGGCSECGGSGFKGRMIIAEALKVSPALQKLIFSSAASDVLYEQAVSEGMVPLPVDGIVKACLGMTSLAEVVGAV